MTTDAGATAGQRTATLATLFLAVFIALLGLGIVIPLLPVYADNLGASGIMIGLMVAGFSISRGVLQPFVGGWSDRHGRKRFLVSGLLIYSVVGFSFTLATSVEPDLHPHHPRRWLGDDRADSDVLRSQLRA